MALAGGSESCSSERHVTRVRGVTPDGRPVTPVVVVADDFGMSEPVNQGVLEAFERRLITDASLMANMPAFDAAVNSAQERGLRNRLGVHLNLTQGHALSAEIRRCGRFCSSEGQLQWTHRNVWRLDASERLGVAAELRAQIRKVCDAGIQPAHLDSHHHVHTAWAIGSLAIALAREFAIPNLRLSRNCGPHPGAASSAYKFLFNRRVRGAGLSTMAYFGSARDASSIVGRPGGAVEVMTHPTLEPGGRLLDRGACDLEPAIAELDLGARMTPFGELPDQRPHRSIPSDRDTA